jgi:hypothetical protein
MKKFAERLFNLLPPQDLTDPEFFQTEVIRVFLDFPDEVVERAVHEIPRRSDRITLKLVTEVCKEFYAPIERQLERERYKALPEPAPRPRTPDEQARVKEQIAAFRRRFRIPEGGLPPRGVQHRVLTAMSKARVRAVLDDCAARKARKEQESV